MISGDRLRPSDVGPPYVAGEILVGLHLDTAESDETIEAVASAFGGTVVGGVLELLLYQLRFAQEELQELRALADEIEQLRDVEFAGVHYLAPFDPNF